MAFIDQNLVFSDTQVITATAASTSSYDMSGGTLFSISPNQTRFGQDLGIGDGVAIPKVLGIVTATFSTGGSPTLNVQFQGSTDSSTWTTYVETGAIAAAVLLINSRIFAIDWPVRLIGAAMPRYVRLNYVVASGPFTTGSLFSAIVLGRDDSTFDQSQYGSGYSVGV